MLETKEELQNIEYFKNEKSFLGKVESIFHIFKGFLLVKYRMIADISFKIFYL